MATAYVLINCELGSEENVISELKNIEGVREVHGTFGAYDILAKVYYYSNVMWQSGISRPLIPRTRIASRCETMARTGVNDDDSGDTR